MTKRHGKILLFLGIAILVLSSVVLTFDYFVGSIAFIIGVWNVIKGYRVMKGKQPLIIRFKEKLEMRSIEKDDIDPFNPEHREKYNDKDNE